MLDTDKQALINGNATIPYRITIIDQFKNEYLLSTENDGLIVTEDNEEILLQVNDIVLTENDIISTTYEDYRYVDTSTIVIGQFVARTLSGQIKSIEDINLENKELKVELGVKNNDNVNYYSLGHFLVTSPDSDEVKDIIEFEAMDYTKKFNLEFDANDLNFPCTALELAEYCCNKCGVVLGTLDFTNNDFVIENNQYETGDTYRKVMQDIGKLAYSWVRIGWDDKCYIDFNVNTEVADGYDKIGTGNYYDLSLQKDYFGEVNRVVIGMSDVEGENVYIEDSESIEKYGVYELQIMDNNLTYTPELRQSVIEGAKRLFGLKFLPLEINTTGHPWLIGKELIEIETLDGEKLYTIPFDRTIEYKGHIKTKLTSKADTRVETEYKNPGTLETEIKKTRIVVDKQNQTITSIVQNVSTIENTTNNLQNDLNNNKQSIETLSSEITQTTANVTTTISQLKEDINNSGKELKNTMVTIDINGINVSTNLSAISTLITNERFVIKNGNTTLAYFGYDNELGKVVSLMDNISITNYLIVGYHRFEKFEIDGEKRTGCFYIG